MLKDRIQFWQADKAQEPAHRLRRINRHHHVFKNRHVRQDAIFFAIARDVGDAGIAGRLHVDYLLGDSVLNDTYPAVLRLLNAGKSFDEVGLTLTIYPSKAAKFEAKREQDRNAHLNLRFEAGIPLDARGLFAELSGAVPMSEATRALLKHPSRVLS